MFCNEYLKLYYLEHSSEKQLNFLDTTKIIVDWNLFKYVVWRLKPLPLGCALVGSNVRSRRIKSTTHSFIIVFIKLLNLRSEHTDGRIPLCLFIFSLNFPKRSNQHFSCQITDARVWRKIRLNIHVRIATEQRHVQHKTDVSAPA